ncbi:MAG: ATP-binding cassette domain-containing protein, partial [Thermoprotei archaeon]
MADFEKTRGNFILSSSVSGSGLLLVTGPNGSGKTTFLRCIAGIEEVDRGQIIVNGRDITHEPANRRRTVYIDQNTFFAHMDVESHLKWGLRLNGVKDTSDQLVNRAKEIFGVKVTGKVGEKSLGERERIAIATAMLAEPEAVLIDEAVSNISNPQGFTASLKEYAAEKRIDVVLVSQDTQLLPLCDAYFTA